MQIINTSNTFHVSAQTAQQIQHIKAKEPKNTSASLSLQIQKMDCNTAFPAYSIPVSYLAHHADALSGIHPRVEKRTTWKKTGSVTTLTRNCQECVGAIRDTLQISCPDDLFPSSETHSDC